MKEDIFQKINKFLLKHNSLVEECEVVYLMVEIRKILDQIVIVGKECSYPILRFYCDWAVHTKKDRIAPEIKQIMEEVYKDALIPIDTMKSMNKEHLNFISMSRLHSEILSFMKVFNISNNFSKEDEWGLFQKTLINILVDQPIIRPVKELDNFKSFSFKWIKGDEMVWQVDFNDGTWGSWGVVYD